MVSELQQYSGCKGSSGTGAGSMILLVLLRAHATVKTLENIAIFVFFGRDDDTYYGRGAPILFF